jgi:ATP-binding cassette subfamily F protein uup
VNLLLTCKNVSKSFSTKSLFQDLSFSIHEGDRVGLIGLNGSGKSTLLKMMIGEEKEYSGMISLKKELKIGYVPQNCEFPDQMPEEILIEAIKANLPSYEKKRLAEMWLSKLQFTQKNIFASKLSGGWKKRLSIAVEMINEPELLFLDEPTNHLDLDGIIWLEKFLSREAPTYLLVSHDRYFLQNTTTRIIEVDKSYPKGIFSMDGSYSYFLQKKEEFLAGQLQQERSIATKARRETEWLRAGVKARTTKSQSRIDEAKEILDQYADLRARNREQRAQIGFVSAERETRKLLTAKNISKEMGGKPLFSKLDFTLCPGTRIGLMGPNGVGKTTLLRMLAGEIEPDQGTLKRAEQLKVVYFDQHRAQLPNDITLRKALSPAGDFVLFNNVPVHVNGWCKRFLFSPDLLDLPISKLSGGEKARISIAHLMLQPADLLLLDEPTNDLDIPTLETLEESLLEFPGAVVLITHDRCMLDRICNLFLALGEAPGLFADYAQWENSTKKIPIPKAKEEKTIPPPKPKAKLSYLEKKEWENMEATIQKLEAELLEINQLMEQPEIATEPDKLAQICQAAGLVTTQIEQKYLRWEELEKKNET